MDETPSQENAPTNPPDPDLNKLDLSQLQGFSFGTQWTQEKRDARDAQRADDRPRREGAERRDRRTFRKPAGEPGAAPGGDSRETRDGQGRERTEFRGAPRRTEFRGARRDDQAGGRGEFRGSRFGDRGPSERGPYDSPNFSATFYPEDTSFTTLAKTIRSSCRTIELFEIARTVIGKAERFVVVVQRKAQSGQASSTAPAEGAPAVPGVKPAPLAISVPDGVPFESEDAAINHVLQKHVGQFFDTAEVEIEPPKGNYQIINRCTITGELLAPPNYHRYNQIVQQHFTAKISRMSFDAYRSRIESVRDPELVNQWLEKMKKVTRYTWKQAPAPQEGQPAEQPAAEPLSFDSLEDARIHLLTHARDKVVRLADSARFHGRLIEELPQGEIRRSIEGTLERQRRFPLDTANALRGRLRREGFTIFKKGSKGVSYVCAVKRKFRVPGQTFSETINALISFIEANPMVRVSDLPERFLKISLPRPAERKPAEGEAAAQPELSVEDREKLAKMQGDLLWLVREGYVTEFIDSRLFAPPPMVEARKKEVESEEHDPENFPEAPVEPAQPAPEAAVPASPAEPAAPAEPVAPVATPSEPAAPEPESDDTPPPAPQA
ncbi:hypothetical protein GALL_84820 [mine drainage metagenome]|uniref:Uncharacterized protein n=1 Tax=mine drainage metagenome TaxID=410659 RepID=A0A1J5SMS4_9ZZZZ